MSWKRSKPVNVRRGRIFRPLQSTTTAPAARLVRHAGIRPGDRVLDVACGTGVVAVTAAPLGARVTGLDLTPELLVVARDNAGRPAWRLLARYLPPPGIAAGGMG